MDEYVKVLLGRPSLNGELPVNHAAPQLTLGTLSLLARLQMLIACFGPLDSAATLARSSAYSCSFQGLRH